MKPAGPANNNSDKFARKILTSDVYKIYVQGEIPMITGAITIMNEATENQKGKANKQRQVR